MFCQQARRRLDEANWSYSSYSQDTELLEHLKSCKSCYRLAQAEARMVSDFEVVKRDEPLTELSLETVRRKVESTSSPEVTRRHARKSLFEKMASIFFPVTKQKLALAAVAVIILFAAVVPFNFREQVGYQIAIDGVEKDIAVNNQKITSLLGALGMEKDKAITIADSLGVSQVRLSLGQCTETCRLTISDLKTERDVRLMVKAIIELGCCHIDDIVPIFRNESTSLLRLAARKLLS